MQKWEYEIVRLSKSKDRDMNPLLDAKGKLGWELVSVVGNLVEGTSVDEYLAFFRRPMNGETWSSLSLGSTNVPGGHPLAL